MDLGEGSTTRSFSVQMAETGNCSVHCWNDESCGATSPAPPLKVLMMQQKVYHQNATCLGGDYSQKMGTLGSAMMVCN